METFVMTGDVEHVREAYSCPFAKTCEQYAGTRKPIHVSSRIFPNTTYRFEIFCIDKTSKVDEDCKGVRLVASFITQKQPSLDDFVEHSAKNSTTQAEIRETFKNTILD